MIRRPGKPHVTAYVVLHRDASATITLRGGHIYYRLARRWWGPL